MEQPTKQLADLTLNSAVLTAKRPAGKSGTAVTIVTNLRALSLKPNTPIYKYDVNIQYVYTGPKGESAIEVSKSTRKGAEKERDLEKCLESYKKVVLNNAQFQKGRCFFYDRQACLYSLIKIPGTEKGPLEFVLNSEGSYATPNLLRIVVKFTAVADSFQSTSNDVKKTVNVCPKKADRTLLEALNAIISSPAYENENIVTIGPCIHYFISPYHAGFEDSDTVNFEVGNKYSSIGVSKSVKTLEGTGKEPSLFVVTDLRTTLFHQDDNTLLDKLASIAKVRPNMPANDYMAINMLNVVKGMQCYTTYGKSGGGSKLGRIYTIKSFGPSARSHMFTNNGSEISMLQYYECEYRIKLRFPDLFTVRVKGKDTYIPVELLCICGSQVVRNEQMANDEQATMIRHSALKPEKRVRMTDMAAIEAGLVPSQPIAGIVEIENKCVEVVGRCLPAQKIAFAKFTTTGEIKNKGQGQWLKGEGQYLIPATINKWEFHIIDENLPKEFVPALVNKAKSFGVRMANPVVKNHTMSRDLLYTIFSDAKKNGIQFLFFVTRDSLNLHNDIKSYEHEFQICTQEVRGTTAVKRFGASTMENAINKINMKNGGLNYAVGSITNDPKRLFIGFETAQRNSGTGLPVVAVGYSANTLAHPQQYAGGWLFVKKDKTTTDVYKSIIKEVIQKAIAGMQASRKINPSNIFIFFNGISDGQYSLVASEYVEEIKAGCGNLRPHLTVMAVNKTHNERLVQRGSRGLANPTPGTVVDKVIVSNVINEFYLTSSNAFQGTSKTPKYALIYDTAGVPMEKLEEMAFELCHLHEIVQSTTSLPAPLLIADRFSKRGAMVLGHMRLAEEEMGDVKSLNKLYTYDGKALDGRRFNA